MLHSACVAGLLGLLLFAFPAAAETPIGQVVAAAGSPSASGPGGSRGLAAGSAIYEDDKIVTDSGNVQIIFIDNTRLLIGPRSSLVVERFLLRGGRTVRKLSIDALRGTFRFISGNSRKSAYNLTTANATISLHGTAFDVAAGDATVIAVYAGAAGLCTNGKCETVSQRCGVARARGGTVAELKGRAKALALKKLPYLTSQGRLARPFRVDTSACATITSIFQDSDSERDGESSRANKRQPGESNPAPQ
jgi:hypothetical protein